MSVIVIVDAFRDSSELNKMSCHTPGLLLSCLDTIVVGGGVALQARPRFVKARELCVLG
jgi:hypothetical protein